MCSKHSAYGCLNSFVNQKQWLIRSTLLQQRQPLHIKWETQRLEQEKQREDRAVIVNLEE